MKRLATGVILFFISATTSAQSLGHGYHDPNSPFFKTDSIKISQSETVDSLCQIARTYYLKGQYNDGLTLFKKAAAWDENNSKILSSKAWAYLQMADYDSAITGFDAAIKLNPEDTFSKRNLMRCFAKKQDFKKACSMAKDYIKDYPNDADGYYTFMLLQLEKGNFSEAIEKGQKAVELYEKTNSKAIYSALYWLATAYYAKKDYLHSDELFERLRTNGLKVEEKYRLH